MASGKKIYESLPGILNKLSLLMVCLLLTIGGSSLSCKDNSQEDPPTVVVPANKYLSFKSSTENQIQVSQKASSQYELTTTGEDPYVSLTPLNQVQSFRPGSFHFRIPKHQRNQQHAVLLRVAGFRRSFF